MSGSAGGTYFYLEDGQRLGSADSLLPITLYKGMIVTVHGHDGAFEVLEWSYHHGHPDEEWGLKIVLKQKSPAGEWGVAPLRI
jgi:hypothetical protein